MPRKKKIAAEEKGSVVEASVGSSDNRINKPAEPLVKEKPKLSFIGTLLSNGIDLFHTTAEELAHSWRDVRLGQFSVVKSAVWNDDEGWADLMEHLKWLVVNPPETPVKLGFELFSGGRCLDFLVDWGKSQTAIDGSVVLLRSKAPTGPCLALAPKEKYIEGFRIEGADYAFGARLVLIATSA